MVTERRSGFARLDGPVIKKKAKVWTGADEHETRDPNSGFGVRMRIKWMHSSIRLGHSDLYKRPQRPPFQG